MWLLLVFACGRQPSAVSPAVEVTSTQIAATAGSAATTLAVPPTTAVAAVPPLVDDPEVMAQLQATGLGFGPRLTDGAVQSSALDKLARHTAWKSVIQSLQQDLQAMRRLDPKLGVGMAFAHRQFDVKWLSSPHAQMELIGVSLRLDRHVFDPATCGELRAIYRLAYSKTQRGQVVASRLPMTVNLVWLLPHSAGCRQPAQLWQQRGILAITELLAVSRFRSLELNLQASRWPSTVRPDMGGHAEYLLRVFVPRQGGGLQLGRLENTPDVPRLQRDSALRNELLQWLGGAPQLAALDNGSLRVPDKFLATKASSFALHGLARQANRPWSQLFSPQELNHVATDPYRLLRGPKSLVRRLDDMTCTGCHQGRTIAGFHLLGRDGADTVAGNAVAASRSPHLQEELVRRTTLGLALAAGLPADWSRPFSERATHGPGKAGEHCGLPGSEFAPIWTCGAGLNCLPIVNAKEGDGVGECWPERAQRVAGSPCEPGTLSQQANPAQDRLFRLPNLACRAGLHCETTSVGFPGGMCSSWCNDLQPGEACGAIAILQPFNACLAAGKPFGDCVRLNTRPGSLQACDEKTSCRADYICAKLPEGGGGCIPPYFLFQLRVDGHPSP